MTTPTRLAALAVAMLAWQFLSLPALSQEPAGRSDPPQGATELGPRIATLVEQLADDQFQLREAAARELEAVVASSGAAARKLLKKHLAAATDLEVKLRLEQFVKPQARPTVVWKASVGESSFNVAAPALGKDVCVFFTRSGLTVLDRATGAVRWRKPYDDAGGHPEPVVFRDELVISAVPERDRIGFEALDIASGQTAWHLRLKDLASTLQDSGMTIAGDRLFAATRGGHVLCVDAVTGERAWLADLRPLGGGTEFFRPMVAGGRVLCAGWGRSLVAVAADDGKALWRSAVPGIAALPPSIDRAREDGTAYVVTHSLEANESGGCVAIDVATGQTRWTADLAKFGGGAIGGPVIVEDVVVAGAKTHLVGIGRQGGKVLWSVPCPRFAYSTMSSDEHGVVHAGTDDGDLLAVAAVDGKVVHRVKLVDLPAAAGVSGQGVAGCPTVADGVVYVATTGGLAVAVKLPPASVEREHDVHP